MKSVLFLVCLFAFSNSCRRRDMEDLDASRGQQPNKSAETQNSKTTGTDITSGENSPQLVVLPPEVVVSDNDRMLQLISGPKLEEIKTMIESGKVSIDLVDSQGQSLLILATKANRYSTVEYLLKKNKNLNSLKDKSGKTALDYALDSKNRMTADGFSDLNEIELLIKLLKGEEVNPQDFIPELLTILSGTEPQIGIARFNEILRLGVDVNTYDSRDLITPEGEIIEAQHVSLIFYTLGIRRIADKNAPIKSTGILAYEYAESLVKKGAKIDVTIKLRNKNFTPAQLFEQVGKQLPDDIKSKWREILKQN